MEDPREREEHSAGVDPRMNPVGVGELSASAPMRLMDVPHGGDGLWPTDRSTNAGLPELLQSWVPRGH